MIHKGFLLVFLTILKTAFSLPVKGKINPVDLKYYCVKVTPSEETGQSKIPILLIHGLGGSHKEWDGTNLLLSLQTNRKVCSVDLRNHGDSPWNKRTDVKALVVDIGHFLDEQGIKKVNIIGHSLGGTVAVHYTMNNPSRVNSIIVEDMRPNGIVKTTYNQIIVFFKALKEALAKIPTGVTEEKAREILVNNLNNKLNQIGVTEKFSTKSINFLELKLVDRKSNFRFNIDAILKAMNDPSIFLGKSSGVYKGPALFIYGDKSSFKVGEDKSNILKMFPKAKLVPVEGAGHTIHGEFRKFDDEVVKFLNEIN